MLKRHCDVCDKVIEKYVKLNAKEYGGGKETVHKPAIFTLEICKECWRNMEITLSTIRTEQKIEFL
jgi:hypothetical protein